MTELRDKRAIRPSPREQGFIWLGFWLGFGVGTIFSAIAMVMR